jgi:hypothetical protein
VSPAVWSREACNIWAGLPLSNPVFLCLKNTLFIWKAVVFYHMP